MNFRIAIVISALLITLTGCVGEQKDTHQEPIKNAPAMGTKVPTTAITDKLEQKGLFLTRYDKKDWTLNGMVAESYYVTACSPKQDCKAPQDHISIYTFKSEEERKKGFTDFNKQKEHYDMMIIPIVWQYSNSMVLYWHHSEAGKKSVFEDKIGQALEGWEKN